MRHLAICRVESSEPGDPPDTTRLRPLSMWSADLLNAPPMVPPWRGKGDGAVYNRSPPAPGPDDILDDLKRYEDEHPTKPVKP